MTLTNQPPLYHVHEFATAIKKHIENEFSYIRIRGEISSLKRASSGHVYFTLKDDDATLNAICWRSVADKLTLAPEDGQEVIAHGKITVYGPRSNYQIIVEKMEIAGEGALLKMLQDRRKKLQALGLFDKQPRILPMVPRHIGVITSPTGAVLQDILHRITERMPCHVMLYPVKVQGVEAAEEITAAIHAMQHITPKPDVIIVARGGGSLEDLWCFNDEALVKEVASCQIPIISAIGHETDHNLIDDAADYRAPTPTAAAELVTPVRQNLLLNLDNLQHQLKQALLNRIQQYQAQLGNATKFLQKKSYIFDIRRQHCDMAHLKITASSKNLLQNHQKAFARIILQDYHHLLSTKTQQWHMICEQISQRNALLLQKRHALLAHHRLKLESYSYRKTLERGFALIKNEKGHFVKHADELQHHETVEIILNDGTKNATIHET